MENQEASQQQGLTKDQKLVKVTRAIWYVTGVLEALFGLRFLLKLIAADPQAGFAIFIYSVTGVFLVPFQGLTAEPSAGGSVLELWTLVAMIVYALAAWGIVQLIYLLFAEPN